MVKNLRNTVVQKKRNCQFLTLSLFRSFYYWDCFKKEKRRKVRVTVDTHDSYKNPRAMEWYPLDEYSEEEGWKFKVLLSWQSSEGDRDSTRHGIVAGLVPFNSNRPRYNSFKNTPFNLPAWVWTPCAIKPMARDPRGPPPFCRQEQSKPQTKKGFYKKKMNAEPFLMYCMPRIKTG